jgi:hypothetical protein
LYHLSLSRFSLKEKTLAAAWVKESWEQPFHFSSTNLDVVVYMVLDLILFLSSSLNKDFAITFDDLKEIGTL